MAQAHRRQNGTPVNPSPPVPGLSSSQTAAARPSVVKDEHRSNRLKRAREDDSETEEDGTSGGDVPAPKRRGNVNQDVLYRIVVPSRQIGKVIGRVGHRIQKIREETQATIKIADAIARHEERVIIISSKDSENDLCNAELALHHVVSLILKDDGVEVETPKLAVEHVAANTIRLLIAGSQAGSLIGLNGQNIENLRTSSGASISVLSQTQLPLCASAHESDRVVQISGDIDSVQKAVMEIGCHLRDNPPNQVISINLPHKHGFSRQPHQYVDPTSAEYVNLEIMVPESMVGGLIGRCGSNISRIRTESGATIKVYGGKGEQTQRQIHLGGSAQQVALAKQRIDEYVYSQMMQQSGVQQSLPAVSGTLFQANSYLQANSLLQGYGHNGGVYMNRLNL
ncbi:OLC1v1038578C3 [Oldenlandia corymbosa var. corymbosa]|uniref:OLC1v1038578C3 n=1 Tax=Oldenlandia corymbosa var. corymbosa TaxID=529605 RepID=A0AAV1D038_OLDCO|nr:OLC1v1038578C3 [Oldenlandia corymbosa var. corymbosa]